jgi:hypothetical protein
MKLERLHEYILPTVVILGGVLLAVFTGHLSGNGQVNTLFMLLAGLAFAGALLILRENICMLVPLSWALTGQIPLLPVPFEVRDLVVLAVLVAFLTLKALKIVRVKPKLGVTERWMFLMLLYLVTVYIRNPVGVQALGAEKVGGRPYFDVAIACVAYWILARSFLSPKLGRILPLLLVGSRTVESVLGFIAYKFPSTAPIMREFYSSISTEAFDASDIRRQPAGESTDRQTYLSGFAANSVLLACSYWRPLTVVNPIFFGRFLIFATSFFALLLTGFRSAVLGAIMTLGIGSYLRRGLSEILPLAVVGVPILALVLVMQGTVFNLPLSAQRALSFLPGHWDSFAAAEAEASTEWRVYMWKVMLAEDKYIQNKWLGDGFGFAQHEFEVMLAHQLVGDNGDQEYYLIIGGVHSGPLSTIRYVGYVGLGIFIVVLCLLARDAWRLARRALGTPYLPIAMFVCIPVIWEPINYLFIFGGFDGALPANIYLLGMLKLLSNSLDVYERGKSPAIEKARPSSEKAHGDLRPALARTGSPGAF